MEPSYEVRRVVRAAPKRLFEAWIDSREHTAMTGVAAEIGGSPGQAFSLLDGRVKGVIAEVDPYHRIMQRWSGGVPPAGTESRVELSLATGANYGGIGFPHDDGTTITVRHWDLAATQTELGAQWWEETYFKPMDAYFAVGDNRFTRPPSI